MRENIDKEKLVNSLELLITDLIILENDFEKYLNNKDYNNLNNSLKAFYNKHNYISTKHGIYRNLKYYSDKIDNLNIGFIRKNTIHRTLLLYQRYHRNILKSFRQYYVCDLDDLQYFNII